VTLTFLIFAVPLCKGVHRSPPTSVTVLDCNLTQQILEPTHIKGNTLDLVFTNNDISISNLAITPPGKVIDTDHFLITFSPDYGIQFLSRSLAELFSTIPKKPTWMVFVLTFWTPTLISAFNPMTLNLFGTS